MSLNGNELRRRIGAAALLALAACAAPPASPPAPLVRPPELTVLASPFVGTSLSGASADAAPLAGVRADRTPLVRCELFLLREPVAPGEGAAPLIDDIQFVARPGEAAFLRGPTRLALSGERLQGEAARTRLESWRAGDGGNACEVADVTRPLPRGTACTFAAELQEYEEDPRNFLRERPDLGDVKKRFGVDVELAADGSAPVTLDLQDVLRPTAGEEAPGASSGGDLLGASTALAVRRELIRLRPKLAAGGEPLVVVVPSPFRTTPARACALALSLSPPPAEGVAASSHALAVTQALAELESAVADAKRAADVPVPQDTASLALKEALAALAPDAAMRPTLVFLTGGTRATFGEDLALVLRDRPLVAWLRELIRARADLAPDAAREEIGWFLERAAWRFVLALTLGGELDPSLDAVVLRHTGAAGRLPTVLEDALEGSRDLASFEKAVVDANRDALEDVNAAARVRAFDWLSARGLAPEKFDPLADEEARRHALAAAAAEARGD
jgi:hypothetical protein